MPRCGCAHAEPPLPIAAAPVASTLVAQPMPSRKLPTTGCILLCVVVALLSCIATAGGTLLRKAPGVHLLCQTSAVMDSFVKRAGLLYSFTRSADEVLVTTQYAAATATANAVTNGIGFVTRGDVDFAIMPAVASPTIVRQQRHDRATDRSGDKQRGNTAGQLMRAACLSVVVCRVTRVCSACDHSRSARVSSVRHGIRAGHKPA